MKAVVYPADWLFRDPQPPLGDFGRRFLAEGDSWFTIGTLNLPDISNLLFKLEFTGLNAIVSCAYPGDTLQHMVDNVHDVYFDRLLRRKNFASYWEAILFSAGGNDLIDGIRSPALAKDGSPAPLDARLLLTPVEAETIHPGVTGAERYVSEPGWRRLAGYLLENFRTLIRRRDEGPSRDRPVFLHTYAIPSVRPWGTIGRSEGWLYPALVAYGIPPQDRQSLSNLMFERLRELLLGLDQDANGPNALPHVYVYDSAHEAGLIPAASEPGGSTGDWTNEIHPNSNGYAKIGKAWGSQIDAVLARYP